MYKPWRIYLASLLFLLAMTVQARVAYVTDAVPIDVFADSELSGTPLGTLRSGDRVEVQATSEAAGLITASGGLSGWVPLSYLSEQTPLRVQLEEKMAQITRLEAEIAAVDQNVKDLGWMRVELRRAREAAVKAEEALGSAKPELQRLGEEVKRLENEAEELRARLGAAMLIGAESKSGSESMTGVGLESSPGGNASRGGLKWLLFVGVAGVLLGIAMGVATLDYVIRRRHGGFRIY